MPLVSVVTPVYNEEPYLAECIESILSQTHRDWEYVIIDNCSTDATPAIARRYAERDPRIRIVRNPELLPQLRNFNTAVSLIAPESAYCKMVLADDWLFPRCLEEMVAVAEAEPDVAIVSSYRLDGVRVTCDGLPYPSTVIPGHEVCRATLRDELFVFGSMTTLLLRSSVVRSRTPFFDEGSLHSDTDVCYALLADHDLGFVHQVLSFTRRQDTSITAERKLVDPSGRLGRLLLLHRWGATYLDAGELAAERERLEGDYCRYVAERSVRGADDAFWAYHRDAFRAAGVPFPESRFRRERARAAARRLPGPLRRARRALAARRPLLAPTRRDVA